MTRAAALLDAAMTVQRSDIADIDATIALWRESGLRARDVGEQLQCGHHWYKIRRRMIVMVTPPRNQLSEVALIALIGARYRRGLTQKQVADRIGVCQVTLSDYENSQTAPTDEILAAWREAVGLRVSVRMEKAA